MIVALVIVLFPVGFWAAGEVSEFLSEFRYWRMRERASASVGIAAGLVWLTALVYVLNGAIA